jgi:pimeloyl-ACP methyl ester carboxylesterase
MTTAQVGPVVAETEGEGPTVVMIHGLGGTSNMFQPQMQALRSFRVVRLDLPGSGRAPRPLEPLSVEGMGASVVRALAALGVERAHFVGHSMGTIICQWIASNHPRCAGSLFLLGALAEPSDATRTGLGSRARMARSGGMSDIADQIVAGALSAHTRENSPAAVAFVRESITRQDPESYAMT